MICHAFVDDSTMFQGLGLPIGSSLKVLHGTPLLTHSRLRVDSTVFVALGQF